MAHEKLPCSACGNTTVAKKKWNNNYYCAFAKVGRACWIWAQSVIEKR